MSSSRMDRTVEWQGCNLSYSVQGVGPPVLLIQGVGVQGLGWQPQIDELASEYQCILCDMRFELGLPSEKCVIPCKKPTAENDDRLVLK